MVFKLQLNWIWGSQENVQLKKYIWESSIKNRMKGNFKEIHIIVTVVILLQIIDN